MKVIFVRHGEINLKTGALNSRGIKQIKNATKYLKGETIDAIYCSPKLRTIQSANILKEKFPAELFIEKKLDERQILSPSENQKFKKDFDENYLNYAFQSNDFETCRDFIDRNFECFNKIKKENVKTGTVMIVAHSSTLYAINAFINGIPKNNQINWLQCNNGAVIKFIF